MEPCPMLAKCRKASGIDCTGRPWEECDFYNHLIREKHGKYKRKKKREVEEEIDGFAAAFKKAALQGSRP